MDYNPIWRAPIAYAYTRAGDHVPHTIIMTSLHQHVALNASEVREKGEGATLALVLRCCKEQFYCDPLCPRQEAVT